MLHKRIMIPYFTGILLVMFFLDDVVLASSLTAKVVRHESLALIGQAKYHNHFTHFNYANPDAPKGGTLRLASTGSFDNLNQYAAKGQSPEFLFMLYDRLMTRSQDEPYSLYPQAAMSVEYAEDVSWIAFNLNPSASFHDGQSMSAEDVVFTVNTLKASSSHFVKKMVAYIKNASAVSRYRVKFDIYEDHRNIKAVAMLSYLPVLPEHFWKGRDFNHNHLNIPLGSGPMKIIKVEAGRSITYERVKDYWGANLPVNKGQFNFDRIHIDYYRDNNAALEAFAAGTYDLRIEGDSSSWHQKYSFPAIKRGDVIMEDVNLKHPHGMSALVFNTRKEIFNDHRVRLALNYLFNFEWTNKTLLHSDYLRSNSYFVNTDMAASGIPSGKELAMLERYRKQLPKELFTTVIQQPVSDCSAQDRTNRNTALKLLSDAGWHSVNGRMVNKKTSKPMMFELLLSSPAMERVFNPYRKNLSNVGIQMKIKTVDHSHFRQHVRQFNFDMVEWHFWHSSFPSIEQANSWGSQAADEFGSNNLAGIKNLVIDQLLEQFGKANHYEEVVTLCRAIDRILLWNTYVIPKWHKNGIHLAYRKHLAYPKYNNLNWFNAVLWWHSGVEKNSGVKKNKEVRRS